MGNDIRYVCPKCGSQLIVWQELICEKQRLISSNTGKVYRKYTKTELESLDHMEGIKCYNESCNFVINTCLGDVDEYTWINDIKWE